MDHDFEFEVIASVVYGILGITMAAVDGHTARHGRSSAAKSRHDRHRTGTRSTDAVVGLTVSPPMVSMCQSPSLPPLSARLHAAVSQGLIDTAAELLDSGVIFGPDKVPLIFVRFLCIKICIMDYLALAVTTYYWDSCVNGLGLYMNNCIKIISFV